MSHGAQITDQAVLESFLLAGRATVTIVSRQTGRRFTFKVEQKRIKPRRDAETDAEYGARMAAAQAGPRFVKVMTGPDNESHYTYVGHIDEQRNFRLDRKSKVSADAPSVSAWQWFWKAVVAKSTRITEQCEVWHDGRCAKCGRKLTVPESIATGLGPVCAGGAR